MAIKSGRAEGDGDEELAVAVHRVLAILTDLRSDAQTPALSERIKLVHWLRAELGEVEALLVRTADRRDSAPVPPLVAADR